MSFTPFIPDPYAPGDVWTADAAGGLAVPMLETYDAMVLRHSRVDARHKDPRIPVAAALVTCSGTVYTLRSAYNVSGVSRLSAGVVKLSLIDSIVADGWGAEVSCITNDTLHFGTYVDTTTSITVTVQLVTAAGVAADVSFLVLVYGSLA